MVLGDVNERGARDGDDGARRRLLRPAHRRHGRGEWSPLCAHGLRAARAARHRRERCRSRRLLALSSTRTPSTWDIVMGVNLRGVMLSMKHEARAMVAAGSGGSIINIASLNAIQPAEGMGLYCATKAAVDMYTKCAAMELGPHGIRVNSIAPRARRHAARRASEPDTCGAGRVRRERATRSHRHPDDVAGVALFLASDDASLITGDLLRVDGGAHTKRYPELGEDLVGRGLTVRSPVRRARGGALRLWRHARAAVDHVGLAGDPRREVAGEERREVRDVLGLAESSCRHLAGEAARRSCRRASARSRSSRARARCRRPAPSGRARRRAVG